MEEKEFLYDRLAQQALCVLREQAELAARELCEKARLKKGQIVVVGCSTSRILGKNFGSYSHPDAGEAVFSGITEVLNEHGIYLAAQCCEHLNRAIVIEREAVPHAETVNVIPQIKAGGSFATTAYHAFRCPVVLEEISADAGIDIGGTMIGMHLKKVAVPLTLDHQRIGDAIVLAARTRPKFIGGVRAVYDERYL
ncbi:MAG: TIGR01440 family protein [Clostridia bacterium]|nr:TIGR01440 family protein [Clostridia bacterium]